MRGGFDTLSGVARFPKDDAMPAFVGGVSVQRQPSLLRLKYYQRDCDKTPLLPTHRYVPPRSVTVRMLGFPDTAKGSVPPDTDAFADI